MITRSPIKLNPKHYEALGDTKAILTARDYYRFRLVKRWLYGKSILDIGCGRAEFLNTIKHYYRIAGVEVNAQRVGYCNQVLGKNTVRVGNLSQGLNFDDNSFDTVTCLEVLEHLEDPEEAIKELVRVSRKRVIITVPYNEEVRYVLCVHCAQYTPHFGHLHTFIKDNLRAIVPDNANIVKMELACNNVIGFTFGLRRILRLPIQLSSNIDRFCNRLVPNACWILLVLDKNS